MTRSRRDGAWALASALLTGATGSLAPAVAQEPGATSATTTSSAPPLTVLPAPTTSPTTTKSTTTTTEAPPPPEDPGGKEEDRKSVGEGKSGSVRVDTGCRRTLKKKKNKTTTQK